MCGCGNGGCNGACAGFLPGFVGSQSCTSPFGNCCPSPGVVSIDAFDVPECDSTVEVTFQGNLQIPTGVDIFNPAYGHFEITAINASGTGFTTLTLTNVCATDNQDPGFNVPGFGVWILTEHALPD